MVHKNQQNVGNSVFDAQNFMDPKLFFLFAYVLQQNLHPCMERQRQMLFNI